MSDSQSSSVLLQHDGDIATVILNRPDRLNAFNLAMWERLGAIMTDVGVDPNVRCVVLRGADRRAFGAGADIAEFQTLRANAVQAIAYAERMDPALTGVRDCPHPTVAMIQGPCVGGGLEVAILCDLRICGESARFGIPINRIGHALPYAAMMMLVDVVGRATALEILLEGRIFNAAEALAKGLVTRVVPDDVLEAEVAATAERIASGAPLAARWHKKFAMRAVNSAPLTPEEAIEPFKSCDTEDYQEGVRAFLAKETPRFRSC